MTNSTLGRVGLVGALILCGALTGCGDNGNDVGFEEPDGGSGGSGDDTSGDTGETGVGGVGGSGSGDDTSGTTDAGVAGSGEATGGTTGADVGGSSDDTSGTTDAGVAGSGEATGGTTGEGVGGSVGATGGTTGEGVEGSGTGGHPACPEEPSCASFGTHHPEAGENCECFGEIHCQFQDCEDGYNLSATCNGETWQVEALSCEVTHCGPQEGVGLHCAANEICRVLEGVGPSLEYSCEPNPCLDNNQPTSCECAASLCEFDVLTCEMREEGTMLACVCEDCN